MSAGREGAANARTLLFIIFGHMIFGFYIGLPAMSIMGLIGVAVTAMWHFADEAADQRRIESESRLRKRIQELEDERRPKVEAPEEEEPEEEPGRLWP